MWFIGVLLSMVLILSSCDDGNDDRPLKYSINEKTNNAILGPLENASVSIYQLTDLENSIEKTTTGNLGSFDVSLGGINDNELLLVSIEGGNDIDVNIDGIIDITPTEHKGTINALAKASDLKSGKVNVTLLSEIIYQHAR